MAKKGPFFSFIEAQAALKAFDEEHWKHKPGRDTIFHDYLHLLKSLQGSIGSKFPGVICSSDPAWKLLPGILLEHAFRLANDRGILCSKISWEIKKAGKLSRTQKLGLLLNIFAELIGLTEACRLMDDDRKLHDKNKIIDEPVKQAVVVLAVGAGSLVFMELRKGEDLQTAVLNRFEKRLEYLEKKAEF